MNSTRRPLTIAAATAATLILWTLADPIAGIHLKVRLNHSIDPIGAPAVIAATLLAALAAWGLVVLLERTRRAGRSWTITTLVVLAVSLTGPLGSGVDVSSKLILAGLHLVVAAVVILGFRPKSSIVSNDSV